jgi:hypothetical protein
VLLENIWKEYCAACIERCLLANQKTCWLNYRLFDKQICMHSVHFLIFVYSSIIAWCQPCMHTTSSWSLIIIDLNIKSLCVAHSHYHSFGGLFFITSSLIQSSSSSLSSLFFSPTIISTLFLNVKVNNNTIHQTWINAAHANMYLIILLILHFWYRNTQHECTSLSLTDCHQSRSLMYSWN